MTPALALAPKAYLVMNANANTFKGKEGGRIAVRKKDGG